MARPSSSSSMVSLDVNIGGAKPPSFMDRVTAGFGSLDVKLFKALKAEGRPREAFNAQISVPSQGTGSTVIKLGSYSEAQALADAAADFDLDSTTTQIDSATAAERFIATRRVEGSGTSQYVVFDYVAPGPLKEGQIRKNVREVRVPRAEWPTFVKYLQSVSDNFEAAVERADELIAKLESDANAK